MTTLTGVSPRNRITVRVKRLEWAYLELEGEGDYVQQTKRKSG